MDVKQQLGYKINRKITQEKLAEMTNISPRTLSGIEIGENFMTAQTLEKILQALEGSLEDLLQAEHLKPTEVLIDEINSTVLSVKNNREKIENIYKVVKVLVVD